MKSFLDYLEMVSKNAEREVKINGKKIGVRDLRDLENVNVSDEDMSWIIGKYTDGDYEKADKFISNYRGKLWPISKKEKAAERRRMIKFMREE